ncbi:phospholipase D-like domain-containing protein [Mycobacterium sp. pW049]|uniref:phospholipase D-like domain-containing protein n=1 Tax=[Mycobacterium] bulgaricum TaxID=3238985 RepID=UPI00351BBC64
MRAKEHDGLLTVGATAGTYVVQLGLDMAQIDCEGLLGFSIHRRNHTKNSAGYLRGQRAFRSVAKGRYDPPFSTEHHPLQGFQWSDYQAEPGHRYTYTVSALKGSVESPDTAAQVSVDVVTEDPENGAHDVYFNRGAAASQQYANRFQNRTPSQVGQEAFTWLSRGLWEAMRDFIRSADSTMGLRICAYEFDYGPLLAEVAQAIDRGVDVRLIYDRRDPDIYEDTESALRENGLTDVAVGRQTSRSYISHNKFILKLADGGPASVWTGGTNFSEGGIFGHSNVAHVVEDPVVAAKYLAYWEALAQDPSNGDLWPEVERLTPLPAGEPESGTTVLFSPRQNLDALNWYAARATAARDALFMTFAFGMNPIFQKVYKESAAPLRFALLESLVNRSLKADARRAAEEQMQQLRNLPENTFAVGSLMKSDVLEGWVAERLSGLNTNVHYIHNKFMLIDPLSADPIVVNGSANFSDASTRRNDENMLVVRGDKRLADVFLTEFMRMHQHHAFRESQQFGSRLRRWGSRLVYAASHEPRQLASLARREGRWLVEPTDSFWPWWPPYFDNIAKATRRTYFANPHL